MKCRYIGITYPKLFQFGVVYWAWKRWFCPKHMHLWDECWSDTHTLHCDACGMHLNLADPPIGRVGVG